MKLFKPSKKIVALICSIFTVIIILMNSTYSLLFKTDETDLQNYTTGVLTITSSAINNSVTLTNALPMEDSVGEVSTPYTFRITNEGSVAFRFDVKLLSTSTENQIAPQYIKIKVDDGEVMTLNSLTDGIILEQITLNPGRSIDVDLRVWLDINTPNTQIGKVFNAKILTEGLAVHTDEIVITPGIDNSGANFPQLTDGLIPVMYDESRSTWVKADITSSTSEYGWYDYDNKKWANAVLVDAQKTAVIKEINKIINIENDAFSSIVGHACYEYENEETGEWEANENLLLGDFTFTTGSSGGTFSFDYKIAGSHSVEPLPLIIKLNNETIVDVDGTSYCDYDVVGSTECEDYYSSYSIALNPNTTYVLSLNTGVDGTSCPGGTITLYNLVLSNNLANDISRTQTVSNWELIPEIITYNSYTINETGKFNLTGNNYNAGNAMLNKYICSDTTSTECEEIYQVKTVSDNTITSVDTYIASALSARDIYINAEPGTEINEDNILAYYVWIPRYKYKVWNKDKVIGVDSYNAKTTGIDTVFENGIDSTGTVTCTYDFTVLEGEGLSETCIGTNGESYYTHPAFTFGNKELTGIWVAKYEFSPGNEEYIKPGLIGDGSFDYSVGDFHNLAKGMQVSNNRYGLSADMNVADSHVITNMEWGAMAYLTHSKYGRCTDNVCSFVESNNTHYEGGESVVTGEGGTTTANVYGIYDTVGGYWETVMGNSSSRSGSYVFNVPDNSIQYNDNFEKYLTTYSYGTTSTDQSAYNRTRLGDAIGEINFWYSDGDNSSIVPYFESDDELVFAWIRRSSYGLQEDSTIFNAESEVVGGSRFVLISYP